MFDHIFELLTGRSQGPATGSDRELKVCVAALLVEAARMDDHYSAAERSAIERILAERYELSAAETGDLLATAERAVDHATKLFRFTDTVVQKVSVEDRVRILEMMWEVAYADGALDPEE